MASSLGGYTIEVDPETFREICRFKGVDTDTIVGNAGHIREHVSYGSADTWTFTVAENTASVPWANSVALAMIIKLTSGEAVELIATFGTRHSLPANKMVYVMNVNVKYNQSLTARYTSFTVRAV